MKKIYLLILLIVIFSSNVFASKISCEIIFRNFYAKTGDLQVEFLLPHDDFKIRLKYKENSNYGLVIDDIYWSKVLVKKIKNLIIDSKKDLLKLTKNKKHKINLQEIEDIFNIKIIDINYKYENQTYHNQLLLNKIYSEEEYKGQINNELNNLIKDHWVIDLELIDLFADNEYQEHLKKLIRDGKFFSDNSGFLFNFDNEKIKNDILLMTKKIDNTNLESKIFYSQNNLNIKNNIRFSGLAGDTNFTLILDGNCDNAPEKLVASKKSKQTNKVTKNDTIGPEIIVDNTFEANQNLTAIIKGRVKDESEIAQLTIGGFSVSIQNNTFTKYFFVQPEGQSVEIISIDIHGNRSNTSVNLKRASVKIPTKQFDFLDPRKLRVKIKPHAVALIIGVEDYENTVSAPFAKKDALAFNDFAHSSFGVPQYNIKLLTNDQAGRTDILKAVAKWLPKVIDENKTDLYLFFSGHGLASEDGKDLFLLPADGDPELLEDSTLFRNRIFQDIAKLNPRSVTVFLDTCYSGATRSEEFLVAAKPIFIEVAEQEIPNNFTVFSASAGKETAKVLKEAEHGLFSYFLMKGLEGEADTNKDQQITNGELIAFINQKVSRQANQTPQLAGDASRILVQW